MTTAEANTLPLIEEGTLYDFTDGVKVFERRVMNSDEFATAIDEADALHHGKIFWQETKFEPSPADPLADEADRMFCDVADRNQIMKEMKKRLELRSGMKWSVRGGKGTAYGWLHISAPPSRKKYRHIDKVIGVNIRGREIYEEVFDEAAEYGSPGPVDRHILALLLNKDHRSNGDWGVPSSRAYYVEFLARCAGRIPSVNATPYWD